MSNVEPVVKAVCCDVLEKTLPEESAACLEQACGEDREARQRAEALPRAGRARGKLSGDRYRARRPHSTRR